MILFRKNFTAEVDTFSCLISYAFFLIVLCLLSGCSRSYKDYAAAHHRAVKVEAEARSLAFTTAFQAVKDLCKVFDEVAAARKEPKFPIMTREGIDIEGNPVIDTVYFPPQDTGIALLLAGVAKSMVLREIYPMIKEITSEMTNKLERPVTVEEVLLRVADEAGLLAVIGGMYGLGKEGIRSAGAGLNNVSVSSGAALGVDNPEPIAGNNSTWTDNHKEKNLFAP